MSGYERPPLVASVQTNAVAGTVVGALVAAPGVGFRVRVVGGHVGCNRVAATAIDLILGDGVTLMRLGSFQAAGTTSAPLNIPEPGIQFADNAAVGLSVLSTAATGAGVATIEYYIDNVT